MFEVVQVSVATPALLGRYQGREVFSSIRKHKVDTSTVVVTPNGIEGDEQADKRIRKGNRIHGGPLKAVYAYPLSHLGLWAAELGISDRPATLGENLTVDGLTEDDVRVGDLFMWGDVLLKVSGHRRPCYKLVMHLGMDEVARQMTRNGRCGWYFEVVRPGTVRTNVGLELVSSDPAAPTITSIFAMKMRADSTIPDD